MNYLKTQADKLYAALVTLSRFAESFGEKLPEQTVSMSLNSGEPACHLFVGFNEADRQRALALFGDVFGRDGWTATLSYNRQSYDWERDIDGVRCRITGAETVPTEKEKQPVPPTKFPLQLADAA